MRYKKILLFFLIFISITTKTFSTNTNSSIKNEMVNSQKESFGISTFIQEAEKYSKETLEDISMKEILNSAIIGQVDNNSLLLKVFQKFLKEIKSMLKVLGTILIIIVVHSVLKAISEGLENETISHVTYYVQYILLVTLIMTNFSDIIVMIKDSIHNLVGFSYTLIPLLLTLMMTTGNIASVSAIQPILLILITFIGSSITTFILPMVLVSTSLGIISKVSSRISVDKISKFMNSSVIWILGIVLTLFVGILSLEGSLTSGVDGVTAKTTKAAVSSLIPVVGKILGDSVDSVIGGATILKNAVGFVGIVVIIGICIIPVIRLTILTISYYLASAVCDLIADQRIVSLLSQMGNTFKVLLAILISISMMLIIGIAIVIKISNSSLMYR